MVSVQDTLRDLKYELTCIGSTKQEDYDLLKRKGQVYSTQICRRLRKPWNEIIIQLGFNPRKPLFQVDKILELLVVEFKRLNSYEREKYRIYRDVRYFPHPRVLTNSLNMSWLEIIERCGCPKINPEFADVSDEELISEFRLISKKIKNAVTEEDIKKYSGFSIEIYYKHFGSIEGIKKACGFKKDTEPRGAIISKQDCENELRNIYNEYGRLSYEMLNKKCKFSVTTILRRFQTTNLSDVWDEVLQKNEVIMK